MSILQVHLVDGENFSSLNYPEHSIPFKDNERDTALEEAHLFVRLQRMRDARRDRREVEETRAEYQIFELVRIA
jgi:hypothetical protein